MRPALLGSTSKAVVVLTAACALSCVTSFALPQSFGHTTITITATATDSSGFVSAETVLTVTANNSLHAAKSLADGAAVHVTGLIATTSSTDFAGVFYGESAGRAGGVGIIWNGAVSRGDAISVTGTMITVRGERFIAADTVTCASTTL